MVSGALRKSKRHSNYICFKYSSSNLDNNGATCSPNKRTRVGSEKSNKTAATRYINLIIIFFAITIPLVGMDHCHMYIQFLFDHLQDE